jgi:predicted NBD/HSP70 family sugar kinase
LEEAGAALAHAVVSAASVLDFEACLIDGWLPGGVKADLISRITESLKLINTTGLTLPMIKPGSVGVDARSLGAASLPLSDRFLLDQNALLKDI